MLQPEDSAVRTATVDAVLAIARDTGISPDQVAIAWAMTHGSIPILGPRTVEQATSNLGAATLTLSDEQITRLDTASGFAGASRDGPHPVA